MSHHELPLSLAAYEYACLTRAIDQCDGNLKDAAKLLGIGKSTMYRRLEALTGVGETQRRRADWRPDSKLLPGSPPAEGAA